MVNAYFAVGTGRHAAKGGAAAYSRHVGRVGALAVALGVGFAVATSSGVAWANPDTESSSASGTDSSSSGSDSEPTGPGSASPAEDTGPAASPPAAADAEPVTDPTSSNGGSQDEVTLSAGDAPTVIIRSSGGAHDPDEELVDEQEPVEAAAPKIDDDRPPPAPEPPAVTDNDHAQPMSAPVRAEVALPEPDPSPPASRRAPAAVDDNPTTVTAVDALDVVGAAGAAGAPTLGALEAPAAAAPPDPIAQLFAVPATLLNAASTLLTGVLNALVVPAPGAPPDSPLIWAVLAVVRRQFTAAFANSTPVLNPQQTSQDVDDRQVHGTLGASDVDGDPLTFTVPTSGVGAPAHGDVVIDQVNRTWTYTPDAGYSGSDTFTVTASDASGFHFHGFGQEHTVAASVAVTVVSGTADQPPVVTPPPPPSAPNATTGAVTGSIGVVDPDGDPLTYTFAEGGAPKYGTVVIDPVTGVYTYTPNQAGRLRAALELGDTDSFTVVVTQGGSAPTTFARMASLAAAEDGFSETVTIDNLQIAGATLTVDGPPIGVGQGPAGVVVNDRYAYILNAQSGTVTLIDITDNSVVGDPIAVGSFPALAASGPDRVYIVNALAGTVTVLETTDNTVVDTIALTQGASSPGLSPDGKWLFVTSASNGGLYVIDTVSLTAVDVDPATPQLDPIIVGNPPVQNGLEYYVPNGGIAFSEDGSRVYVTRQHAEVVNGAYVAGSGDVVVIGNDPSDPATYLKRIGDPIILSGRVPAAAAVVGDRLYVGTMKVADQGPVGGQFPDGTVMLIDVDPASPTYHQVLDLDPDEPGVNGIEAGPLPLNMAVSPDKSLGYTVNLGTGKVSVIDLIANEKILEFTYDSTPAGPGAPSIVGIAPDGTKLFISNYGENSVVAVTIT